MNFAHRKTAAAIGACRNKEPVQSGSTLSHTADILVDSERARSSRSPGDVVSRAHGAKRRERPPTPQAPQARGAQRWSRDAERPRAIYSFSATACRLDGSIILHRHERHSMHHTPPVHQVNVRTMSACSVLS
ncbi:hypothetical protein D3D02_17695 [Halobellus sp. Atlit-38R]|nr:hypothetical protein D3D02_17695 [Halobellus sp. Atlit-38R]